MNAFVRFLRSLIFLCLAILPLAACSAKPSGPATATATADPCSPANIKTEATQVNALMREFDDASQLASSVTRAQLVSVIPSLQAIRRRAQDQDLPACLTDLKTLQVTHMNTVISTLLSFVSGASTDQLIQGIQLARTQHEDYNRELARLLGATYEPPATLPASLPLADTETPPPAVATQAPVGPTATTPSAFVTNPGPGQVNIRSQPVSYGTVLGMLDPGLSLGAVGKTLDGKWIKVVDSQGNFGWVYTSVVKVTHQDLLPVVNPTP